MGITQDKQGIQTESAPEELGVSFLDASNFPDYFKQHLEITSARLRGEEHNILLGEKSDSVAGVIQRTAGASLSAAGRSEAEKKKKREEDTARFLEQIRKLQEEIAALDLKIKAVKKAIKDAELDIAEFTNRIEILKTIQEELRGGKITVASALQSPEVRLAVAGWEERQGKRFDPQANNAHEILQNIIIEEQIKLDASHKIDRINEKNDLEGQLAALKAEKSQLTKELKQLDKDYKYSTSNEFASAAKGKEYEARFDKKNKNRIEITGKIESAEQDNTKQFMQSISHLKNDKAAYHAAIDSFIRGENGGEPLDDLTLKKISTDSNLDMDLRTRVALYRFLQGHADIQEYKNTSEYATFVSEIIVELPKDLHVKITDSQEYQAVTGFHKSAQLPEKTDKGIYQEFNGKSGDNLTEVDRNLEEKPELSKAEHKLTLTMKS